MAQSVKENPRVANLLERQTLTQKDVLIALTLLFFLNLLLRVFYLRYDFVNGDEAVRAITAVRLLEGARLYSEIVTDKPPGATVFYATILWLFGRSMLAVHLIAALLNFATSLVLYHIAARFYDRRTGLWAALLFIYFSTNYYTQDMMAANTELLMALPYTASFYLFLEGRETRSALGSQRRVTAALVLAGLLTGVAALFKQVAVFNLLFFAIHEVFALYRARNRAGMQTLINLASIAIGFSVVVIVMVLWLNSQNSLLEFWHSVVVMGSVYVGALPTELWLKFMVGRTLGYVLFNLALWLLAAYAIVTAVRARPDRSERLEAREGSSSTDMERSSRSLDLAVALWAAVSLLAAFTGGRFFGHYFIQVLPALSLLGSRGLAWFAARLGDPGTRRKARIAAAVLIIVFIIGLVRFHQRTAVLAYEAIAGVRTNASESWGMTQRQREAVIVAGRIRETVAEGEPIYVWGYALDVYWRSGCRPASRYLMPYYMTGRVQETGSVDSDNEGMWSENRSRFIEDLRRERPRLILDVEANLLAGNYPEIVEFIEDNYRREGEIGPDPDRPFVVYRLRE